MSEDDFWVDPDQPAYGLGEHVGKTRGRYHFPDPPGYERPKDQAAGWMRMTNLAAAFSDQIRLQHWRERMILLGLREDEVLFDELAAAPIETMDPKEAKDWLEKHADRAASVAKADQGARRGTARHLMLQTYLEQGVIVGTRSMRLQLESLLEALERHELDVIPDFVERRVCNTAFRVMGTLDMGVLCRRTGQRGILDLKTQRSFWSYLEISGQQYGYDSAEWVWEGPPDTSGRWVRPPVWDLLGTPGGPAPGKRVALLAHMPQEPGPNQLPVELHEVSLEFGHRVLTCAMENVRLRSIGQAVSPARRIGGRRELASLAIGK